MNAKITILLLVSLIYLTSFGHAQTNAKAMKTNTVARSVVSQDPLILIREGLRVREAKLEAIKSQIVAAESKLKAETTRHSLAKSAGNMNNATRRQNLANQENHNNQITGLRKQKAAMELEIFDIRARYNLQK